MLISIMRISFVALVTLAYASVISLAAPKTVYKLWSSNPDENLKVVSALQTMKTTCRNQFRMSEGEIENYAVGHQNMAWALLKGNIEYIEQETLKQKGLRALEVRKLGAAKWCKDLLVQLKDLYNIWPDR